MTGAFDAFRHCFCCLGFCDQGKCRRVWRADAIAVTEACLGRHFRCNFRKERFSGGGLGADRFRERLLRRARKAHWACRVATIGVPCYADRMRFLRHGSTLLGVLPHHVRRRSGRCGFGASAIVDRLRFGWFFLNGFLPETRRTGQAAPFSYGCPSSYRCCRYGSLQFRWR